MHIWAIGTGVLLSLGVAGWLSYPHIVPVLPSERVAAVDAELEEGFVEETEAASEPEMPVSTTTGAQNFRGWSRYWDPFTEEEQRFYGNWKRPDGPVRVGIQSGHWKNDEVPDELKNLEHSTGARSGAYTEQEAMLVIAQKVKMLIEAEGVVVDLLPATVPTDYVADAFISIHADGGTSPTSNGYKISGPRRDFSGKAFALVDALNQSYDNETGLRRDSNVTRRMVSYYAFNWRRYDHAIHPMTPGALVETGFITNATDRRIIVDDPDRAARGIANGVLKFLGK